MMGTPALTGDPARIGITDSLPPITDGLSSFDPDTLGAPGALPRSFNGESLFGGLLGLQEDPVIDGHG